LLRKEATLYHTQALNLIRSCNFHNTGQKFMASVNIYNYIGRLSAVLPNNMEKMIPARHAIRATLIILKIAAAVSLAFFNPLHDIANEEH